jgi:hypothetical protein
MRQPAVHFLVRCVHTDLLFIETMLLKLGNTCTLALAADMCCTPSTFCLFLHSWSCYTWMSQPNTTHVQSPPDDMRITQRWCHLYVVQHMNSVGGEGLTANPHDCYVLPHRLAKRRTSCSGLLAICRQRPGTTPGIGQGCCTNPLGCSAVRVDVNSRAGVKLPSSLSILQ